MKGIFRSGSSTDQGEQTKKDLDTSRLRKLTLSVFNGCMIVFMVAGNIYFQAFCIPATWAIIVLSICFANLLIYPWTDDCKFFQNLSALINGISFCVFIYCIIFLEHLNWAGIPAVLVGFGLLIFIPHILAFQILWNNFIKPPSIAVRGYFIVALFFCLFAGMQAGREYEKASILISESEASQFKYLEKNLMTERILGMHFIYHTRICEYDGWRPPIHDPILVVGMWLNGRRDPLQIDLPRRLMLYQKFFPGYRYKFECSCAVQYSSWYHNDQLWDQD